MNVIVKRVYEPVERNDGVREAETKAFAYGVCRLADSPGGE